VCALVNNLKTLKYGSISVFQGAMQLQTVTLLLVVPLQQLFKT